MGKNARSCVRRAGRVNADVCPTCPAIRMAIRQFGWQFVRNSWQFGASSGNSYVMWSAGNKRFGNSAPRQFAFYKFKKGNGATGRIIFRKVLCSKILPGDVSGLVTNCGARPRRRRRRRRKRRRRRARGGGGGESGGSGGGGGGGAPAHIRTLLRIPAP